MSHRQLPAGLIALCRPLFAATIVAGAGPLAFGAPIDVTDCKYSGE